MRAGREKAVTGALPTSDTPTARLDEGDRPITAKQAVEAIAAMAGGTPIATRSGASTAFRFPSAADADRVKALLDPLLPAGSTGAVCGTGLLVVSSADPGGFAGGAATSAADGPRIRRFLDLSTHHLPQEVLEDLNGFHGVIAHPTPHGAWLWVPDEPSGYADEYAALYGAEADDTDDGSSPEVVAVQVYARGLGCDYVLFDADAEIDDALPSWLW